MNIYGNLEYQLDLLEQTVAGLDDALYTLRRGELSSIGGTCATCSGMPADLGSGKRRFSCRLC